jgi:hypothetical protein
MKSRKHQSGLCRPTEDSDDVKATRAVADATYKDFIARINAQILLNEGFASYVKAQNALIERYRFVVAQRRVRSAKKR